MRILYLDLDTLRPDHLGCYGYSRNTSPNIDKIAKQSVRLDNYYCSDAPCLPSRMALMTGRFGIHTGIVGHGGTAADLRIEGPSRRMRDQLCFDSLPGFLRRCGLKTVSISPFAERHSMWAFYAGFSEMHNTGKGGAESAEEVTPTVLQWIKQNAKEDNWFLQLNYWDAHTPYRAPESFGNPFENDPLPNFYRQSLINEHRKKIGPHVAQDLAMFDNHIDPAFPRYPGEIKDMDDMRKVIDGYDCGIRYMDEHVGLVLDAFANQGVLDDLIIIISADHGENMGELGIYTEHGTADHATCRIPMIVKWPNCKAGHIDTGLHYNLDLPPTLAELFGRPPAKRWDGQSFAKSIMEGIDTGRDYLVVGQCAHVCQRGVRFDDYMYIRTYHDGFHLFPDEMLFNLQTDPYEQNDIATTNPDICLKAADYLNHWHSDMMTTMANPNDPDPLWTVIQEGGPHHAKGRLSQYVKRLAESGRGDGIEELIKRHPDEFQ